MPFGFPPERAFSFGGIPNLGGKNVNASATQSVPCDGGQSVKRNWISKALFVLIVTLLLAGGFLLVRQPRVASAQSGRWKVMLVNPIVDIARQLEQVLNSDTWSEVKLYSSPPGGSSIAVLKK